MRDAERVRALREAVSPKIGLMMDANKGATFAQALRLAKLCEPYNLTWFEDPVLQADVRLMARLRSRTSIPIAAGSTATRTSSICANTSCAKRSIISSRTCATSAAIRKA